MIKEKVLKGLEIRMVIEAIIKLGNFQNWKSWFPLILEKLTWIGKADFQIYKKFHMPKETVFKWFEIRMFSEAVTGIWNFQNRLTRIEEADSPICPKFKMTKENGLKRISNTND